MKISIITINFNNRTGLEKTVASVVKQSIPPYEFIVIDGDSSDGSKEVLERYKTHFSYWVSEPDKGIYNAMNKGIDHASGDWCIFLNSGDSFCNNSVLQNIMETNASADIIVGNAILLSEPPFCQKAPTVITMDFMYQHAICHQSTLIKTSLMKKYKYDETYRIVSDRKFFIQTLILDNVSYQSIDVDIADYDVNGFSGQNHVAGEQEYRRVLEELLPARILVDYGTNNEGALFTSYEKLFLEIGKRNYRAPIYRIVRSILSIIGWFIPSARFVRHFPNRL